MTATEAYRTFMDDRKVNGLAKKTLEFYRDTAGKFIAFCEDCNLETASRRINTYFQSLQDRELSQNSIHAHWRGVKVFWRFVHEERYVDTMPKLPNVRKEKNQVMELPRLCGQLRTFCLSRLYHQFFERVGSSQL